VLDFDIKHRKGKENKVTNSLRKMMHAMQISTIHICESNLRKRNVKSLTINEYYLKVNEG
jgi:hypothetical protein